MSTSHIGSFSPVSHSTGFGEEIQSFLLQIHELSKEVFLEKFGDFKDISTDEFKYSGADEGHIPHPSAAGMDFFEWRT